MAIDSTRWTWTADEWARIVTAAKEERHYRPDSHPSQANRRVADRAARALRHYAKVAMVERRPAALDWGRFC